MWSRLQMLLRPKWLIRLNKKRRQRKWGWQELESSRVQEKLNGLLQKVERGSCSLAQPGMEEAGHLWSGQADPRKWQNCSEPVSPIRQGWDCLPPEALVIGRGDEMLYARFSLLDRAQWGFPLKWLMCGSSLPASLHDLDCRLCLAGSVKPADWFALGCVTGVHACVSVCVWTLMPIGAEVCTGIFDAWAWTLTSSGKEPS